MNLWHTEDWICFLSTGSMVAPYVMQLAKKGEGQTNVTLEKKILKKMQIFIFFLLIKIGLTAQSSHSTVDISTRHSWVWPNPVLEGLRGFLLVCVASSSLSHHRYQEQAEVT